LKQQIISPPDVSKSKEKKPKSYDLLIGQRIKELRKLKGLTQKDLANALGVSFQQIQKYEKGIDRISFQRAYDLSQYMKVEIESFLQLFEESNSAGLSDNKQKYLSAENDSVSQKEIDQLLKAYYSIHDIDSRKKILGLVESMAETLSK